MRKIILIACGDREWKAERPIYKTLSNLSSEILLHIDGAARGADTISFTCAQRLGLNYRRFPANWNLYGRAAGPRRNAEMLKFALELAARDPRLEVRVTAFHRNLSDSKGTADMITRAAKAGVQWTVYPPQEWRPKLPRRSASNRPKDPESRIGTA